MPAGYGGVAVASVDDDSACRRAAQNALVARQDVSDLVGLHHDENDLGPVGRPGGESALAAPASTSPLTAVSEMS